MDKGAEISNNQKILRRTHIRRFTIWNLISELSKISAKYHEKLFYQRFGVSPKEYVLSLKIERAKELLLSEKNLVKDVAFQLGYSDIYHFGKIFKSRTGYTPSEYRKENM